MANFDKQFTLLTRELKEIITDELHTRQQGGESIFLLRQAGVDEYMHRSSRSREIQHMESLIKRMEIILEKTGILREDCILDVLDQFRVLVSAPENEQRKLQNENPSYVEDALLAKLDQY